MEGIFDWLLGQAPVVVVMGVGLYVLYRKIDEKNQIIRQLTDKLLELTKESIKANTHMTHTLDETLKDLDNDK